MTTYSHRERVLAAFDHQEPDRVPLDLMGNATMLLDETYLRLRDHLGLAPIPPVRSGTTANYYDERILQHFDIDFRRLFLPKNPAARSTVLDDGTIVDPWGVGYQKAGLFVNVVQNPLHGATTVQEVEAHAWPSPAELFSDRGSCVFPVLADVSYAEIAILEPWACVDVAYGATARRLAPKPGGLLWICGSPDDATSYQMSRPLDSRTVVLSDAPASLASWVRIQPVEVIECDRSAARATLHQRSGGAGVDDIILLNPADVATVSDAVDLLAERGALNLVSDGRLSESVNVDISKLHYQHLALLGCTGPDIAAAYGERRNRSDLRPGGVVWIVGAGGAMGRMHVQRALQMPEGPRAVVATNRGLVRLRMLAADYAGMAQASGRELVAFSPVQEPERLHAEIERLTGGRGCDNIVVVVPGAAPVAKALPLLACDGLLMVFAGAPAGHSVPLPLHQVSLFGAQFTGTSGSTVADQLRVLEKIGSGALSAARTIAAIGGMRALRAGLQAVIEQTYPGKVMIYPQLADLPLLSLPELAQALPDVYRRLAPGPVWTAQAEQALIDRYWTA